MPLRPELLEKIKNNAIFEIDAENILALFDTSNPSEADYNHFTELLKKNTSINIVRIGTMSDRVTLSIAQALETNHSITSLTIGEPTVDPRILKPFTRLAQSLKTNKTLLKLDLANANLAQEPIQEIAEALRTNKTLLSLNLSNNSLASTEIEELTNALKIHTTLTCLDLSSNSLNLEEVEMIATLLRENETLTILNLGDNYLGEEGVEVIADALKTNTTLKTLSLNNTSMAFESFVSMAEALKINNTLTSLDFSNNSTPTIPDQWAQHFAEALRINKSLLFLFLDKNFILQEGAMALAEALQTNNTLASLVLDSTKPTDLNNPHVTQAQRIETLERYSIAQLNRNAFFGKKFGGIFSIDSLFSTPIIHEYLEKLAKKLESGQTFSINELQRYGVITSKGFDNIHPLPESYNKFVQQINAHLHKLAEYFLPPSLIKDIQPQILPKAFLFKDSEDACEVFLSRPDEVSTLQTYTFFEICINNFNNEREIEKIVKNLSAGKYIKGVNEEGNSNWNLYSPDLMAAALTRFITLSTAKYADDDIDGKTYKVVEILTSIHTPDEIKDKHSITTHKFYDKIMEGIIVGLHQEFKNDLMDTVLSFVGKDNAELYSSLSRKIELLKKGANIYESRPATTEAPKTPSTTFSPSSESLVDEDTSRAKRERL